MLVSFFDDVVGCVCFFCHVFAVEYRLLIIMSGLMLRFQVMGIQLVAL